MIVQVPTEFPDPSFAVTVYEEGVPPPTPAATVIVAPASVATTVEIVGAAGAETTHCAVSVILSLTAEITIFPATVVVPVLHPSKLNPDLLMSVATAVVNESPLVTSACVGVAPVPPFNA
jgi:hypothetical protein